MCDERRCYDQECICLTCSSQKTDECPEGAERCEELCGGNAPVKGCECHDDEIEEEEYE